MTVLPSTQRAVQLVAVLLLSVASMAHVAPAAHTVPTVAAVEERLGGADHLVVAGATDPGSTVPRFEYHAYYPSTLEIHTGDVVRFDMRGDHSISFYPGGERRDSLLVPDELPGDVRAEGFVPSRTDCAAGRAPAEELPPCVLSSADEHLNIYKDFLYVGDTSGFVQFDLAPGKYAYFCVFHPAMRGEIAVVPEAEEIATPEQVEAARQAQVEADTRAAEALIDGFVPAPPIVDGDRRVWPVQVGARTPDDRVEVLRFLPSSIAIGPGDAVRFTVPEADGVEWHTATFGPDDGGYSELIGLELRCDLDGKDVGAPGVPALGYAYLLEGACPEGEVETLYTPTSYEAPPRAPGNAVLDTSTVHDSGVLQPPKPSGDQCLPDLCDPWTREPLPSEAEAVFPVVGEFTYACFIHAGRGMTGGVRVSG